VSAVRHLTVVVAIGAAVLLTACGQKGPLTLPDRTAAVVTTPPADAPAAAPATSPTPTPADKSKAKSANSQPPQ
jgi:predicted small lipoprotein YifL